MTQMCVSIPHSNTVVRCPGRRFSKLQKTSLPKQENISLSTVGVSGSRDATSGTVLPRPLLYCVVTSAGIFRIPARRISNCALRTSRSFSQIGGSSFSWISTTMSAHCSGSSARRAISVESVGAVKFSKLVAMEVPSWKQSAETYSRASVLKRILSRSRSLRRICCLLPYSGDRRVYVDRPLPRTIELNRASESCLDTANCPLGHRRVLRPLEQAIGVRIPGGQPNFARNILSVVIPQYI